MGYFQIGKIVNTQGLKGDLRVIPTTDDPKRFELLEEVEIFFGNKSKFYTIEKVWYHKQFVILKFKNIDSINEAEKLKNTVIKIPEEMALPLLEDEYFTRDLFDMEVFTDDGETLGEITDVISTGANDVYSVKNEVGDVILIPAIKQCIIKVDMRDRKMTVKLLKGLR